MRKNFKKMEENNFSKKKFYQQRRFWFITVVVAIVALIFVAGANFSSGNFWGGDFTKALSKTLSDVLGLKIEKPVYELDLATGEGKNLVLDSERIKNRENLKDVSIKEASLANKNLALVQDIVSKENKNQKENSESISNNKNSDLEKTEVKNNEVVSPDCDFSATGDLNRKIYLNEIAWMGTAVSANDEWLEIKNNSTVEANLFGWQIKNQTGKIKIVFNDQIKISPGGFLLLERTDDNSVAQVEADKIYSGAMSNDGEWLKFFDSKCNLIDEVNASWGWGKFGGENDTKKTLERNAADPHWHTSVNAGGTPRSENSIPKLTSSTGGGLPDDEPVNPSPPEPPAPAPTSTGDNPPPQSQSVSILVSEIMAGSSLSSGDEFVELYNFGSEPINLTGWTIKKKSSTGSETSLVAVSRLEGKVIPAGKYFLLAHEEEYKGSVSPDVWWPKSYTLAYINNAIVIYSADSQKVEEVFWAEIPKDTSYERENLTENSGFKAQGSPNPKNSSM